VHLVNFIIRIYHDARSNVRFARFYTSIFKLRSYIEKIKGIYMKGLKSPKKKKSLLSALSLRLVTLYA